MGPEQTKEWQFIRQSAERSLRAGIKVPRGFERLLQLLIIPSFEPCISIELFETASGGHKYALGYLRWECKIDLEKFRTPLERLKHPSPLSPSMIKSEPIPDERAAEEIIQELYSLQIPAWPAEKILGLDGTSYELSVGGHFLGTTFHWHNEPPVPWKPLAEIAHAIVELTTNALANSYSETHSYRSFAEKFLKS